LIKECYTQPQEVNLTVVNYKFVIFTVSEG